MSILNTRIKMCGTTSIEDANHAILWGVAALGFIFYPKSPRNISPEKAREIISNIPSFVDPVGVFVDKDLAEVEEIAKYSGLTHLQLHGNEDREYCEKLESKLPTCKIIKAFRVSAESNPEDFSQYNEHVTSFLLDTYVKDEAGGTGHAFDWDLITQFQLQRPLVLAGGLNPENIVEAIKKIRPFAVDVNSGVEVSPGIKDHAKLEAFCRKVHQTNQDMLKAPLNEQ